MGFTEGIPSRPRDLHLYSYPSRQVGITQRGTANRHIESLFQTIGSETAVPRPNCNPFLVAVALAMVIVAGCGKQPANPKASTGPAPIPVWTSDPSLTDQLGDEQKVGSYSIRPPKGYKKTFTPGAPQGAVYSAWKGPLEARRKFAGIDCDGRRATRKGRATYA
jgi:hypothetical protein